MAWEGWRTSGGQPRGRTQVEQETSGGRGDRARMEPGTVWGTEQLRSTSWRMTRWTELLWGTSRWMNRLEEPLGRTGRKETAAQKLMLAAAQKLVLAAAQKLGIAAAQKPMTAIAQA